METPQNQTEGVRKKKGFNLMVKILMLALVPIIIIVVIAVVAIRSVGVQVSEKLIKHELNATVYAMEMTLTAINDDDYHCDGTNLYKGNYNVTKNEATLDGFKKDTEVDVTIFWGKTRMATTIINSAGNRVVGTDISDKVYNEVTKNGYYFTSSVMIEGEEYYGYYEPLKNSNGTQVGMVFTGIAAKTAKDIYIKLLTGNLILMIAVAIVACGIIVLAMYVIVKAIGAVINNLDHVASGELNFKVSARLVSRSDEVGKMARSVHELIQSLAVIVSNIHHSSTELSAFTEEFQQNFNTINNAISNVNIAVDEIANGATSQADETQKVNTQINDMGQSIDNTSRNVESLLQSTEQMKNYNGVVNSNLNELLQISDRTKESIEQVHEQTNITNESVMNIGSAVNVITDIAEQTNLLSLNASIEAARAGEHGRGFSVVADEIRQLADQSSASAKEIGSIVEELIKNSNISVETMNAVRGEIDNQYDKLNMTKKAFENLNSEVNSVAVSINNISDEVEALNIVKSDVLGSAESLAAIAEENAASTQETSAAMLELGEIVNDCNAKTQALVDIANDMNDNVKKFQVQ